MNQTEINKAKSYLRKRLDEEIKGQELIKEHITSAFIKLAEFGYLSNFVPTSFRFSNSPYKAEIAKVLSDLRKYIYAIIESTTAQSAKLSKEKNNSVIAFDVDKFINQEYSGSTTKKRIADYVDRFKSESEVFIASALILGITSQSLMQVWRQYRTSPFNNPIFNQAIKQPAKATLLITVGKHFGRGDINSSEKAIIRLQRSLAAQAYKHSDYIDWKEKGIIGFMVGRGSSYPCSTCDFNVGFHKLDFASLPPYHANCCCWAYPITKDDL